MALTTSEDVTSVDEGDFRHRVRAFLGANTKLLDPQASAETRGGTGTNASPAEVSWAKAYQGALFDAGLAGLTWPTRYGGQGLDPHYQTIFNEEAADYDLPSIFGIGFGMCIPTLLAHGTEDIKQRYVRPAAQGREIWCQFFSEPGAGSDVASLQTRAVRDGEEWVVHGQKVWTSGAQYCDYGILLARTNPDVPKHKGLTMFVIDVRGPGVTVRPLRQMNGDSGFNEVFFDGARIPADRVVGDVGEGWRVAITTLMNERVSGGAATSAEKTSTPLEPIAQHVAMARQRGLDRDARLRQELMRLYVNDRVLNFVGLRIREAVAAGRVPGPEGSIAKLAQAHLQKQSAQLGAALAGAGAVAWDPNHPSDSHWSHAVLTAPAMAIAGGSNEVMRNIIGERILGLPKEPQVDRDLPFRELKVGTQAR